jgi:hypothetical protein
MVHSLAHSRSLAAQGFVTAIELHRQLSKLGLDFSAQECEAMIKAASDDVDSRGRARVSLDQLSAYLC